jgi:IclR family transcriptional regulator, KDG regulon repressor
MADRSAFSGASFPPESRPARRAQRRKDKGEYVVQTVDRALDILESFGYSQEELGVTDLARKLRLPKNNVFRLLATLECRGYIEQDRRSGNYRLGIKTFEVGNIFLHHLGLRRQARPVLEDLVAKCNETAYLAVADGSEVVYILVEETSHTVRVASRLGQRRPAYCTAAGKVHLAYESQDRLAEIFRDRTLNAHTTNTLADMRALHAHLREVGKQGYAVDDEETEPGVRCLAVPVRDYSRRVVASVGLTGPSSRFTPERIESELLPLVVEAGARISQRLGYDVALGLA